MNQIIKPNYDESLVYNAKSGDIMWGGAYGMFVTGSLNISNMFGGIAFSPSCEGEHYGVERGGMKNSTVLQGVQRPYVLSTHFGF